MKSPFPGMDPWLELNWGDVHHRLIQYSSDALQPQLPDDLRARVEERVFVEDEGERLRSVIPDVVVSQIHPWRLPGAETGAGGVATVEPLVFELAPPPLTEGFIEIRDRGGKVITVIEFLSLANKRGSVGRQKYLEKQQAVLRSDVSLVEIDLLRGGARMLALPASEIPEAHRTDYLACVSLGWRHTRRLLYRMPLRQRLPALPIPLRENEPAVPLDLQALIDATYTLGRYDTLDYTQELDPPFTPDEAGWVKSLLEAAGHV